MSKISAITAQSLNLYAQRGYFSSSYVWRVLVRIPTLLTHLPTQYAVLKVLSSSTTRDIVFKQPTLPFKYLKRNYLVRRLTISARASALIYNYRYLTTTLRDDFLRKVFYDAVVLYEIPEENHPYVVDLSLSSPCYNEGELSLSFKMGDVVLYVLSFTFVPGDVVALTTPTVLLVTRLQGTYGCYPQIRTAMKALSGISLPMFLIMVLEGIAEALNIQHLVGITGSDQYNCSETQTEFFQKVYDDFFISMGATKSESGFFCSTFPLPEKSLKLVNSCNRSRSKQQRKLKRQVASEVSILFGEKRKG